MQSHNYLWIIQEMCYCEEKKNPLNHNKYESIWKDIYKNVYILWTIFMTVFFFSEKGRKGIVCAWAGCHLFTLTLSPMWTHPICYTKRRPCLRLAYCWGIRGCHIWGGPDALGLKRTEPVPRPKSKEREIFCRF